MTAQEARGLVQKNTNVSTEYDDIENRIRKAATEGKTWLDEVAILSLENHRRLTADGFIISEPYWWGNKRVVKISW